MISMRTGKNTRIAYKQIIYYLRFEHKKVGEEGRGRRRVDFGLARSIACVPLLVAYLIRYRGRPHIRYLRIDIVLKLRFKYYTIYIERYDPSKVNANYH
jgi:hypothetical protein